MLAKTWKTVRRPVSRFSKLHFCRAWELLTCNKKCISCENFFFIAIFHEITDTVLSMTWCMYRLNRNTISNLESFIIRRRLRDRCAIFTANNWYVGISFKLCSIVNLPGHKSCTARFRHLTYQIYISTSMITVTIL